MTTQRLALCSTAAIVAALLVPATSPARAQEPDTLRLPRRWEITEGAQAVAESLGVLSGIAVDRNGNVYVSDRGATKIWVFDSLGRSQRGIGRKGEGPGEFQSPTGIAIGPDGRLWVRDINRVSRFMTDGGMTYPEFGMMYRQQPPPRAGRWFVFGADGALRDSIDAPWMENMPQSRARVQISAGSGRMVRGLNQVPFAAVPVWDVTPRRTVLAGADPGGRAARQHECASRADRLAAVAQGAGGGRAA